MAAYLEAEAHLAFRVAEGEKAPCPVAAVEAGPVREVEAVLERSALEEVVA
jgi:hypothetical protein